MIDSYKQWSSRLTVMLVAGAALMAGCDVNKLIADQTGGLLHQGSPSIDGLWDYDMAGAGLPAVLIQLEAFYSVTPDNEILALDLAKAYLAYAQGWVEAEYEIAWANNDMRKADRARNRARLHYLRARALAMHMLRKREAGIDAAIAGGEHTLREYLNDTYKDPDEVAPMFWAGLAWGAAINMALDEPDLIADLPLAKAMVQRCIEIDDDFFNGGAYLFLATAEAAMPPAMGGDPALARELFEKGLTRTGRRNHMLIVNYARIWAVNNQQRALFNSLLMEVIESPDRGPAVRLNNKIARMRAERYLEQESTFFQ